MTRIEEAAAAALRELRATEDQLVAYTREARERRSLHASADSELLAKYPAAAKGR